MAEDEGKKEEEKLELTPVGESLGYISLDQARVLAMRAAREDPGDYGRRFRGVAMAFDVVEAEETEDHYIITLSFRPQGQFSGTLNQYQGGMCIAGVLTTTERTPRHFILPLGPN